MKIVKGDKVKVTGHVFARNTSGRFQLITNMSGTVEAAGGSPKLALVLLNGTRRRHQLIPFTNLKKVG